MIQIKPIVWPLLTGILVAASARFAEAATPATGIQVYPPTPFVGDVTQPPYSARGDGITDDTEALQRALNENVGRHKALYFPKGTYLVSRTLTWPKKWNGRDNWGQTMLRGKQRDLTTIRLKDGSFTNASKPEAIMWCGGVGSADWFHNYVEKLTFDVAAIHRHHEPRRPYSTTGVIRPIYGLKGHDTRSLQGAEMRGGVVLNNCVQRLQRDSTLRQKMSKAAQEFALEELGNVAQHRARWREVFAD